MQDEPIRVLLADDHPVYRDGLAALLASVEGLDVVGTAEYGEVFGYPGFVIADGSVMPGPVGPNPSNTISALAHRFADRSIQGA